MNTSVELANALKHPQAARLIKAQKHLVIEVEKLTANVSLPLVQRVYLLKNGLSEPPACQFGNSRKWVDGAVGYRFCGRPTACECARRNHSNKISAAKKRMSDDDIQKSNEKRKKTVAEKYGVDHISQNAEFRKRVEETSLSRYGAKTSLLNTQVREKIKTTNVERFGGNPTANASVKEKIKQTSIDRYGPDYKEVREKASTTMLEKYGVEHALQHNDFRAKRRETNLSRWGSENHMENPQIRDRLRETCMVKYGVPSSRQIGYSEDDLRMVNEKEYFEEQFSVHGVDGILSQYGITRAVVRNCLEKWNIPYDKNLTLPERIVADILDDLGVEYLVRNRSVISPYELDFYLPSKNLAFEVCGLYWHSETRGKDRHYHLRKHNMCSDMGVRLITIFDDELNNIDLVTAKIRHLIGGGTRLCHGRQTRVVEIDSEISSGFLKQWHVQGNINASVRFGAYFGEELVAVMTFGKLRRALGATAQDGHWELLRSATSGSIPGVASKLFRAFVRNHNPRNVISYCDRRWGTGEVYRNLGMSFVKNTPPGYWYLTENNTKRAHRYRFTKMKLVGMGYDKSKTEKQIMDSLGYHRIWDCGHSLWQWVSDE